MATTIVVTGKGGVGKTTIAALIIRFLRQHATGPVLALDADPDSNLGTVLGVPIPETIGDLREETLKAVKELPLGMDKAAYIEAGLHETIVETKQVDFLAMGRPEGPGCYCYVNMLLRKFSDDLLPSYRWMVMDSEAGMEHLSRRTASNVDHLVVVVNKNPLSLDCARRIDEVLSDAKNEVRSKHLLMNGVDGDAEEVIRSRMSDLDMNHLGSIPHDPELEDQIFQGKSIYELGETFATRKMNQIMEKLGA
jgi:CO dehydrogenase maturation factor